MGERAKGTTNKKLNLHEHIYSQRTLAGDYTEILLKLFIHSRNLLRSGWWATTATVINHIHFTRIVPQLVFPSSLSLTILFSEPPPACKFPSVLLGLLSPFLAFSCSVRQESWHIHTSVWCTCWAVKRVIILICASSGESSRNMVAMIGEDLQRQIN